MLSIVKFVEVCVVFNCFILSNCQYVGVHYKLYNGNAIGDSSVDLIYCLGTGNISSMDLVGAKFDTAANRCLPLYRQWLDNKVTQDNMLYLLKTNVEVRFNPPMLIWQQALYWTTIPGRMEPGSSLSIYTSTTEATAIYFFHLIKDSDNTFMATSVYYDTSTIGLRCTFNETSSCSTQFVANVPLFPYKTHKFSFKILSTGVEVYVDDNFIATFDDPENPMTAADVNHLGHWSSTGSSNSLHGTEIDFAITSPTS